MPSETNAGVETSPFWKQVTTALNLKGHGIRAQPLVPETNKWRATIILWNISHIHKVYW